MVNLLGTAGPKGPVQYKGVKEALALPGCSLHLYGKGESRQNRKMGHATCIGKCSTESIGIIRERAKRVQNLIHITGEGNG